MENKLDEDHANNYHRFWTHKKTGGKYALMHIAFMEKTLEKVVVYTKLGYDNHVWIRPYDEFFDGRFEKC